MPGWRCCAAGGIGMARPGSRALPGRRHSATLVPDLVASGTGGPARGRAAALPAGVYNALPVGGVAAIDLPRPPCPALIEGASAGSDRRTPTPDRMTGWLRARLAIPATEQ